MAITKVTSAVLEPTARTDTDSGQPYQRNEETQTWDLLTE